METHSEEDKAATLMWLGAAQMEAAVKDSPGLWEHVENTREAAFSEFGIKQPNPRRKKKAKSKKKKPRKQRDEQGDARYVMPRGRPIRNDVLSPKQRRVYEYIKIVETPRGVDRFALELVRAMSDAEAQAYWEENLLPGAREAAQAQRDFLAAPKGKATKRKPARRKKNPDAKAVLHRAMRGT
jgi:hypothetical protein